MITLRITWSDCGCEGRELVEDGETVLLSAYTCGTHPLTKPAAQISFMLEAPASRPSPTGKP